MPLPLSQLADAAAVSPLLRAGGLSAPAVAEKARLFALSARGLLESGVPRAAPAYAFFVPGRVEILGKHTDYCGGSTMVAAVERGFCAVAVEREDSLLRIADAAANDAAPVAFTVSPGLVPDAATWANYPMTVARRLARNFPGPLRGAEIAFASDLPPAAGMSSSSALLIAAFLALERVNALRDRPEYGREITSPETLAGYLATIENGQSFGSLAGDCGVGTFGGSEDHTAILCSQPGRISQYAYCPVRLERRLSLPAGYVLAVGSSGVAAEKTGGARDSYNRASRLASTLVEIWNRCTGRADPHLAAIDRGAEGPGPGPLPDLISRPGVDTGLFTPIDLLVRLGHFASENSLVARGSVGLGSGDVRQFARAAEQSHRGAERLLGNQIPETMFLFRAARRCGAVARSAFGAGFGGAVWALVAEAGAGAFLRDWAAAYRAEFPGPAARAAFFITALGPAAFELTTNHLSTETSHE